MPKTRSECAEAVRSAFMDTEKSADTTAVAASRCVAAMIDARSRGRFPAAAGAEEMALISEGLNHALAARACFLKAHAGLGDIRTHYGLPVGFGPDDCPPEESQPERRGMGALSLVG